MILNLLKICDKETSIEWFVASSLENLEVLRGHQFTWLKYYA